MGPPEPASAMTMPIIELASGSKLIISKNTCYKLDSIEDSLSRAHLQEAKNADRRDHRPSHPLQSSECDQLIHALRKA